MNLKTLQAELIRRLGSLKLRQNKSSITLTFTDDGYLTSEDAMLSTYRALRELNLHQTYSVLEGTDSRVYLVKTQVDEPTPFFCTDDFGSGEDILSSDDYVNAAKLISKTVNEAHENTLYEAAVKARLTKDIGFFLNNAQDAVNQIMGLDPGPIDETIQNVMRLSYVMGRAADARASDVSILMQYVESNFNDDGE